jgi:hypothetical protein
MNNKMDHAALNAFVNHYKKVGIQLPIVNGVEQAIIMLVEMKDPKLKKVINHLQALVEKDD